MFEAFQIGPFLFRSQLFFALLGVWLACELFLRSIASDGLSLVSFRERMVFFVLAFLLGGRLFAVLSVYHVYLQDPGRFFVLWDGIFSILGGFIGVALTLFFFTLHERSTFLQWLDALVPSVTAALVFDWVGRFFGAHSYGLPSDLPWGVVIESMSVRYTIPIHPVQLYYAFFFFSLTLILLLARKREHRRTGLVTLVGILSGALGTIFLESFRGDFAETVFAKWSDFLFLSFLFVSLGMLVLFEKRVSHRYVLINSILVASGTTLYLLFRPWISLTTIEWRFSQFLAVLAILSTVVYVVVHRWKYPHL